VDEMKYQGREHRAEQEERREEAEHGERVKADVPS
jgi:hypothetical protein